MTGLLCGGRLLQSINSPFSPLILHIPANTYCITSKTNTHLNLIAFGGSPDHLQHGARRVRKGRVDDEPRLPAVAALDGGELPVARLDGADDADDHLVEVAGRQEGGVEAGVVSVFLGRHGCLLTWVVFLNEQEGGAGGSQACPFFVRFFLKKID